MAYIQIKGVLLIHEFYLLPYSTHILPILLQLISKYGIAEEYIFATFPSFFLRLYLVNNLKVMTYEMIINKIKREENPKTLLT